MWRAGLSQQELRWAVDYEKRVVLVRETDPRRGGIDMKDFFSQVPDDLLPVFENNIAIPWYREKGFSSVSVQAILRRAHLQDTYASGLEKLEKTKCDLQAILRHVEHPTTCFDLIQERSLTLRVVLFMGGFAQLKDRWTQLVYDIVFNLVFWICGALCTLNLYYREAPYHLLPTDFLTAYVHVPAWQSWVVWRRFVKSSSCTELLARVQSSPEGQANLNVALRVGGWLVLILQCVMIVDGLLAFSVPGTLHVINGEAELHSFTALHSIVMWIITPPLFAVMMMCYVMFGFIALLHLLDILAMRDTLAQCVVPLAGFYDRPEGDNGDLDRTLDRVPGTDPHDWKRQGALEENLFKTVADLVSALVTAAQTRIDQTCRSIGALWTHIVFFSMMQVLAISSTAQAHGATGLQHYNWWWGCQDFFHLGLGIILLAAAMGVFCVVTWRMQSVPSFIQELFATAGCPVSRQASIIALLSTRPLGMHIASGLCFVDTSDAVGFIYAIFSILASKAFVKIASIDWQRLGLRLGAQLFEIVDEARPNVVRRGCCSKVRWIWPREARTPVAPL